MTLAAIYDLTFEQGIAREIVVSKWADCNGDFIKLDGYSARLQIRAYAASPDVLFDKSTDAGDITIADDRIVIQFTQEDAEAMADGGRRKPLPNSEKRAPKRRVGVYELRVFAPNGVPFSLVCGDVNVILKVVR
ncbi:hypothetical protein [Paraburkholderia sp. J10-1]|uniref:hypothetical protein n=1 Tax=Paraburkholderia sp. J10-1 TaxID=2805430 RepID=UPI002AB7B586|nr:hypothetical protein [Paraburkholderia sp. J10-1]